MKKLNVFWILIDSARNFETSVDDRGLPKSVADFSKEAIFFKNTVTSAPSTIMSISSMMTCKPTYILSRSYDNFPGITDEINSFPNLLKREGYDVFGTIYFKHGREVLSSLFGFLKNKFLPKGLSHRKEVWTNNDVFGVFKKIIKSHDWKKPTFCYLHYNVRVDDNISEIIEKTIEEIKSKGLYEESVIVVNSDHGYPMPDSGWDPEFEKTQGWGHDKLLTNDNILTPLVIRFPNCERRLYENYVSTLDIIPTITKVLGINYNWGEYGVDLLNEKIRKSIIRTDNRYIGQAPSYSAIIENKMKLIVNVDKDEEVEYEFYDLNVDNKEKNNLFSSSDRRKDVLNFIDKFKRSNGSFFDYHENYLFERWERNIEIDKFYSTPKISVIISSTILFEKLVHKIFERLFPNSVIELINIKNQRHMNITKRDVVFCVIESEIPWNSLNLIKTAKNITKRNLIYIDNNGLSFKKNIHYSLYENYFSKRKIIFKNDKLAVVDIFKRVVLKKVLKPIK